MPSDEEIVEYCDGCKHCRYDALENFTYCGLDLTPKSHPDEPTTVWCSAKEEEVD